MVIRNIWTTNHDNKNKTHEHAKSFDSSTFTNTMTWSSSSSASKDYEDESFENDHHHHEMLHQVIEDDYGENDIYDSDDDPDAIGIHARHTYNDIKSMNLPPASPLEFPTPNVRRALMMNTTTTTSQQHHHQKFQKQHGYDPIHGGWKDMKKLLVRTCERGFIGSCLKCCNNGRAASDHHDNHGVCIPDDRGYWFRKKLCNTVYGSVRLCVVVKRVKDERRRFYSDEYSCNDKEHRGEWNDEGVGYHDDDDDDYYYHHHQMDHTTGGLEDDYYGNFDGEYYWEITNEVVVVKVTSWSKVHNLRGRHLEDPIREVSSMQLLGNYHPNVVSYIETLQDAENLYTVMPYYNGGDLYGRVMDCYHENQSGEEQKNDQEGKTAKNDEGDNGSKKRRMGLDENKAREYFYQILSGLHHLQKKGVCHRDISLDNILIHDENHHHQNTKTKTTTKTKPNNTSKCVIIDMGMSLRVPYSDPCNTGCTTDVSAGTLRRFIRSQGQGGNNRKWTYMAPELVSKNCDEFDGFAIDLWSAGIILYVLLMGTQPFELAHECDDRFCEIGVKGNLRGCLEVGNSEGVPISDEACDLLQGMLWNDPSKRMTLGEVMEHPWVVGVDDNDVGKEELKVTKKNKQRSSRKKAFTSLRNMMKGRSKETV